MKPDTTTNNHARTLVLLAGFTVVYEPAAAVRHSHNYTFGEAFRRFFD